VGYSEDVDGSDVVSFPFFMRQPRIWNSSPSTDTKGILTYWHATQIFGPDALTQVLAEGRWSERYTDLFKRIGSEDIRLRNTTLLPAEVVREIAARPEFIYDFYADPDGVHLYATHRDEPLVRPYDVTKARPIPAGDALSV
jgi:hypothetical protein